jgi:hypothetical protein
MWLLQVSSEFARFVIDHRNEGLAQYIGMVETNRVKTSTCGLRGDC